MRFKLVPLDAHSEIVVIMARSITTTQLESMTLASISVPANLLRGHFDLVNIIHLVVYGESWSDELRK